MRKERFVIIKGPLSRPSATSTYLPIFTSYRSELTEAASDQYPSGRRFVRRRGARMGLDKPAVFAGMVELLYGGRRAAGLA